MKLYYFPKTRAMRPRWCLEEMGIPYELMRVYITQTDKQEYQKLHPHGKVPVLVDEDVTIFESAAICAYLTDADIVTGGVLMWALQLGILDNHQILKAYAEKLRQREAFRRANTDF